MVPPAGSACVIALRASVDKVADGVSSSGPLSAAANGEPVRPSA